MAKSEESRARAFAQERAASDSGQAIIRERDSPGTIRTGPAAGEARESSPPSWMKSTARFWRTRKSASPNYWLNLKAWGSSMPGARSAAAAGEKKITRIRDKSKPCPICGGLGHDARRHRGDKKKSAGASTEEEDAALPLET